MNIPIVLKSDRKVGPKVSVIIPVYKVEEFLEECVESVLRQTYRNLEIILVDDGSPDNCPQLCDKYASRDNRIIVVHKLNGGLSDTRNKGLEVASGEYILFLDSDDFWLDSTAVEQLLHKAQEFSDIDIVFYRRTTLREGKGYPSTRIDINSINGKTKVEGLAYLLEKGDFMASACQKMIRRALLIDNSLFFQTGLLSEDWHWTIPVYTCARRIAAIDNAFYGYRKRSGSITATISTKHISDIIFIIDYWCNALTNRAMDEAEKNIYLGFMCYLYCSLLGLLYLVPKNFRKETKKQIAKYQWLFQYDGSCKTRKVVKLYNMLGYNMTQRVLMMYLKYRGR